MLHLCVFVPLCEASTAFLGLAARLYVEEVADEEVHPAVAGVGGFGGAVVGGGHDE